MLVSIIGCQHLILDTQMCSIIYSSATKRRIRMRKGIRLTQLLPLYPAMLLLCLGSLKGWAGDLEVAEGLFYNDQYKKAISSFIAVLKDPSRSKAEKAEIKYKTCLSYFMIGDMKSSLEFWIDARRENPRACLQTRLWSVYFSG